MAIRFCLNDIIYYAFINIMVIRFLQIQKNCDINNIVKKELFYKIIL